MQPYSLVGIHLILASMPLWATVTILWSITDGVMHLGRDCFEGLGYQVAYSAKFGDVALFGAVFIAITILQRGTVILPEWMESPNLQLSLYFAFIGLGVAVFSLTYDTRSAELMDLYHDMIIAPLVLFFAVTLLPVIYYGGTAVEKFWTVCFISIWVILVIVDIKTDRMNQRRRLKQDLNLDLWGINNPRNF
jgi:hypothetical protein